MMRNARTVALTIFCALAVGAVIAPGAFASNATAYTCVVVSGGTKGKDCKAGEANEGFGHVVIAPNTPTTAKLTAVGNQVLSAIIGSAEIVLTATEVEAVEATIENKELSAGVMDVTGSGGHLVYRNFTTPTPHCAVANVATVPLKVTTTSNSTATLSPLSGETFATIVISSSGGTCSIAGTYPVTGTEVHATTSGSFLSVNTGPGELSIFENEANLAGSATVSAGPTGGEHHAIALT